MSVVQPTQHLVPAVELLLRKAVDEAAEEVVKAAVQSFEAKLRRKIAEGAIDVSNFYTLNTQNNDLVISVKLPKQEQKAS